MPWGSPVLPYYPALAWLRRSQPALREGGLRWDAVTEDVITFWRETRSARLLVLARRATGEPMAVPPGGVNLYGGAVEDSGDGPTFQVWSYQEQCE
jgi:alpha-glucosidase